MMNKELWRLSDEEYEFIKGEVAYIVEKYDISYFPLSGFEISSKLNIKLIPYSSLPIHKLNIAMKVSADGFLIEEFNKEYIFYNDVDRCLGRQNWTILHEIGHIVLDHTGHNDHEEHEADFFAKYAIAPPILIDMIGARSWKDVYARFVISCEASIYAYEYYLSWKQRHKREKIFTAYEEKLLRLYKKCA